MIQNGKGDPMDPKGLVREAYRIDGITLEECRSIFMDWALSLPAQEDPKNVLLALIERYEPTDPGHPMTSVLRDGLAPARRTGRRGGWRGRRAHEGSHDG